MTETVMRYMTSTVHTIGSKQPLADAHRKMNAHAIRHLPVLEAGKLVGILSQRDLHLIETLRDVDPDEVQVEEAMTQEVYKAAPEALLEEVARTMAEHHYGSVVVARGEEILGIFTTVDALRALSSVLRKREPKAGRAGETH